MYWDFFRIPFYFSKKADQRTVYKPKAVVNIAQTDNQMDLNQEFKLYAV